ncbi:MAG TPA: hypothetical protein VFS18_04180 [Actinomycetota bacterium]|nr:hypothetical protein [Actinomycetota bacterium]
MRRLHPVEDVGSHPLDMGDLLVFLVASTVATVRDRLLEDGHVHAGDLLDEVTEVLDDFVRRRAS